jgi:hypothetical protein
VTANDTWSSTNDPLEYIKTTATKANAFNDNPDRGSLILFQGLPATLQAGQTYTATFVVRNTGDLSWTGAAGYKFGQETGKAGDTIFSSSLVAVDEAQVNDTATNSFYTYGGVFRGAPVTFRCSSPRPGIAGQLLDPLVDVANRHRQLRRRACVEHQRRAGAGDPRLVTLVLTGAALRRRPRGG